MIRLILVALVKIAVNNHVLVRNYSRSTGDYTTVHWYKGYRLQVYSTISGLDLDGLDGLPLVLLLCKLPRRGRDAAYI